MALDLRRILSFFALSSFTTLLPLSPARSGPLVDQILRDARRIAENQQDLILEVVDPNTRGVALMVFHNSLQPVGFCYTFILNGDWQANQTEDTVVFTTDSGAASAGFSFMTGQELEGVEGATSYERAATMLDRGYAAGLEKWGLTATIPSARTWLEPTARRVLIWRLRQQPPAAPDRNRLRIPTHYLMPAPNGHMLNLMVGASNRHREEEIARSFLDSFRTTQDPECFFPAVRTIFERLEK
ncbi:MAG: hypothetical protein ER33_00220 [Cyanobium sp. CACIAM 14]|nr:MAG: hypothetical protein ER33_00220 [Cyanobium sp. CACIAM 14]